MGHRTKFLFIAFFLFLSACGAPSELAGKWRAYERDCLQKDNAGEIRQLFEEQKAHTLFFKSNNQVELFYPSLALSFANSGGSKKSTSKKTCDILISGTYSIGATGGSLQFNFIDDETGKIKITKGDKCSWSNNVTMTEIPKGSSFAGDPEVSIKHITQTELQLLFPKKGADCKNDEMRFTYKKSS